MVTRRALLPMAAAFGREAPHERCERALRRLIDGNRRYVESRLTHPDQTEERRLQVSQEQHPFAVILSCSDSRVPPEIIFDEGLGDLFVVRNAGHVVDSAVLGSVEYAVGHLDVPLVLVVGHSSCGAVQAAVAGLREAHLTTIVDRIGPAVEAARRQPGDLAGNAMRENVRRAVAALTRSRPVLAAKVAGGKLRIAGAQYRLETGQVTAV